MPCQPSPVCLSDPQAHFVLVPLMTPGHMIPMVDLARLLATRGATVSFITTPINAARIKPIIDKIHESGLPIQFIELPFPCKEGGLPEGSENVDLLSTPDLYWPFFEATKLLREPLELYLRQQHHHHLSHTCMIYDSCLPWTMEVSRALNIPRLIFHGPSCFYILSIHNIHKHGICDLVNDSSEPFLLPSFPCEIKITRAQSPGFFDLPGWEKLKADVAEAEATSDGVVLNSFHELEPLFIENYEKAIERKVWPVGPLCLYNKDAASKATRGNKSSIDEDQVMSWLDSMWPKPVIFANFGSLARTQPSQLMEVGFGLEASHYPFIWVIKGAERSAKVDEWLKGFEERNKDMGLVIKGWAPQVLILSHPAVMGFLTHCGWNSMLEAVSAGVPMVTWPHFGDQFLNEKLIVDVLRVGTPVGATIPVFFPVDGEPEVKRDAVEKAVVRLMGGGEEGEERRERARKLGEKAKKAMEEGGSSYENLALLINDVLHQQRHN